MTLTPRSKQFDDVYFSQADGLAETRHVFLDGNNLPANWENRPQFTIAETGFGTGLNFLAAWKLFRETAKPDARLDFISIEKYPLTKTEIQQYLNPWSDQLGEELRRLCEVYPDLEPPVETSSPVCYAEEIGGGKHILAVNDNVTATLFIGDVNDILPKMETRVDCWFLDGFKPATNPEMWTDTVFQNMARLSNPGTTFATFTAAGIVKRGLKDAGFTVEKKDGFGFKRDMLTGYKP